MFDSFPALDAPLERSASVTNGAPSLRVARRSQLKTLASTLPIKAPGAFNSALVLRYEVYCLECNFLSPDDYPDGLETDEHDQSASHFYAFDHDGHLAGYVRLVRPNTESRFPFQQHCALSGGVMLPPASEAAEISRLMVRRDYRRRQGEGLSCVTPQQNAAAFSGDRRHEAPAVLLNLYRQMYQHCRSHGIHYCYAAMERSLSRSLSHLGLGFEAIGPYADYFGPVAPHLVDLRLWRHQVHRRDPELMTWLEQESAPQTNGVHFAPRSEGLHAAAAAPSP